MRILAILAALLAASPALAQYWTHYSNTPFGYEIDIPPGYESYNESADGNGAIFMLWGEQQELTVWGERLGPGGFEAATRERQAADVAAGWAITYQAATPDWSSWSGTRGEHVLYQRMILLCDRQSHAAFRSVYAARDLAAMHGVIEGIVRSFVASDCRGGSVLR